MIVHITSKKAIEVKTIGDAKSAVRAHWGRLGGKAFYSDAVAGRIDDGAIPMHVSFNGRVWEGHTRAMVAGVLVEVVS